MSPRIFLFLILAVLLAIAPLVVGGYVTHVLILSFFAVVLGVTFRLLMLGGQASFCHGAFFGIGGYTAAILALRYGIDVWLLAFVSAVAAGLAALLLGAVSLRTKGPYFFLMTFGFLMVFDSAVANLKGLTGGYSGLANIPAPSAVTSQFRFYWVVLGICALSVALFAYLDRTVFGLQVKALGESDQLAEALGIPRFKRLVSAFAIGAAAAGCSGAFYGSYITFVSPNSFGMTVSINALTYNIVGGFQTLLGPVLGAGYVTLIPLAFDWSAELIQIFVSASIIVAMMFRPKGIESLLFRSSSLWMEEQAATRGPRLSNIYELNRSTHELRAPEAARIAEPVLAIENLRFGFGGVRIADGIDLFIQRNEVVGLIGPNGAGKSTIFNLISGFLRPEGGTIRLCGANLSGLGPADIAQKGLVRTFQSTSVFENLSVFDNVLAAALRPQAQRIPLGLWRTRESFVEAYRTTERCLSFVNLGHLSRQRAGDLPYGAKKMLGLAMAVASNPTLLCLDEPVTGLTGYEVEEFIETIKRLGEERDISILIVEHRMPVVTRLCDRVYALHGGKICAEGAPYEVTAHETVRRIYLGESRSHRRK